MAKRKRSRKPTQARHGKKAKRSQHDKRKRLNQRNQNRRSTRQAQVPLVGGIAKLVAEMQRLLDSRSAFRLPIIMAGAMLAKSRRTVSSWFRSAGVRDDWDFFYDQLAAIGPKVASLMIPILSSIVARFDPGPDGYWKLGLDDSPTKRYGRCVEGANVHHNPTPGPADGQWLYGHNWVCLAILIRHLSWGTIALPILSSLYVRMCDVDQLSEKYGWEFRTKHELAVELVKKLVGHIRWLGSLAKILVVADGAYAARPFLLPMQELGVTVVSRLRKDAKLFDVPQARKPGQRGRPRKYGKNRISLSKRAGHRKGWQALVYEHRGQEVTCRYKSFVATSEMVGGEIRVVLVTHNDGGWAAYFSTDTEMDAQMILETVADRWAIEEHFHDVKEVWGAGQQQVRNVWSNIACWNVCGWLYTLVELECWDRSADVLVDRSQRPWDNPDRRPSHADRRKWIAGEMLTQRFFVDIPNRSEKRKRKAMFDTIMNLAG